MNWRNNVSKFIFESYQFLTSDWSSFDLKINVMVLAWISPQIWFYFYEPAHRIWFIKWNWVSWLTNSGIELTYSKWERRLLFYEIVEQVENLDLIIKLVVNVSGDKLLILLVFKMLHQICCLFPHFQSADFYVGKENLI